MSRGVGFPMSLVYEGGRKINWYVNRAGGFLEKADKGKTRVVWPNGMLLPNKGGSYVMMGGSTCPAALGLATCVEPTSIPGSERQ